jgi:hypothetical protein
MHPLPHHSPAFLRSHASNPAITDSLKLALRVSARGKRAAIGWEVQLGHHVVRFQPRRAIIVLISAIAEGSR